jgi:protein AroM
VNSKFATLTIGQAPRMDIVPSIEEALPKGMTCVHAGVLDGMTPDRVKRDFTPRAGREQVISRLTTGETVVLDREAIRRGLQAKINELCDLGCGVILVLCTGRFEGLTATGAMLLEPDHVLPPLVQAVARTSRVGVVVPLPSQMQAEMLKWRLLERPISGAATPYDDDKESRALVRTASELQEKGAQIIVLDCMGYTRSHQRAVARGTGLRVLLSISMMAAIAAELLTSQVE